MGNQQVRLICEPEDGATPIVRAVDEASESIDILVFRLDRRELEHALVRAVERGVRVRALIAHTSRDGEKSLRALEMRLLKAGVTVARTADDLVRYHGKMMIVDGKDLHILGFNFTYLDIDRSRSFGVVLKDPKLVAEAQKIFEADLARQSYEPGHPQFLVSPLNARQGLTGFLKGSSKELLIYDPNISDPAVVGVLQERMKAGVAIRAIGCSTRIPYRKLMGSRLHVRLIVRDESTVFLGSQSLRASELDKRREIGVILEDAKLAADLKQVFEKDWKASEPIEGAVPSNKIAKKVAKAVSKDLPPLSDVIAAAAKEVTGRDVNLALNSDELQTSVEDAVKQAVKEVVNEAMEVART